MVNANNIWFFYLVEAIFTHSENVRNVIRRKMGEERFLFCYRCGVKVGNDCGDTLLLDNFRLMVFVPILDKECGTVKYGIVRKLEPRDYAGREASIEATADYLSERDMVAVNAIGRAGMLSSRMLYLFF